MSANSNAYTARIDNTGDKSIEIETTAMVTTVRQVQPVKSRPVDDVAGGYVIAVIKGNGPGDDVAMAPVRQQCTFCTLTH